jgi:hypothetical protein
MQDCPRSRPYFEPTQERFIQLERNSIKETETINMKHAMTNILKAWVYCLRSTEWRRTTTVKGIAVSMTAAALIVAAPNGYADTPGRHPFYMHARTDLRRAEQLMDVREERNVMRDLSAASREVDAAIRELDAAALWDRKDVDNNPPVDTHPNGPGRFQAIAHYLVAARRNIERDEDNSAARAWRDRALNHINQAIESVRRGAGDDWRDDWLR